MQSKDLCALAQKTLEDHKADDIVVIPVGSRSALVDYMIVASGTSNRHLDALAGYLEQAFHTVGIKPVHVEGKSISDWVLIDGGDVIIHLFKPETLTFYQLEEMWKVDV